jgi:O-antigen/teichoic acid export membrane protein
MDNRPVERRPSFTSAFGFGTLSFAAGGILALCSSIITARIYGVEVIGEFALAYAPTGAVWFLSSVREQPALIRLLAPLAPRSARVAGLSVPVFAFSTALTLVSCLIAAAGSYLLFRGPIGHPELFAPAAVSLGGYLLFTNPAWNIDSVLAAFRAGRELFWIRGRKLPDPDRMGPDRGDRRLVGNLARTPPLRAAPMDPLAGPARRAS